MGPTARGVAELSFLVEFASMFRIWYVRAENRCWRFLCKRILRLRDANANRALLVGLSTQRSLLMCFSNLYVVRSPQLMKEYFCRRRAARSRRKRVARRRVSSSRTDGCRPTNQRRRKGYRYSGPIITTQTCQLSRKI